MDLTRLLDLWPTILAMGMVVPPLIFPSWPEGIGIILLMNLLVTIGTHGVIIVAFGVLAIPMILFGSGVSHQGLSIELQAIESPSAPPDIVGTIIVLLLVIITVSYVESRKIAPALIEEKESRLSAS